MSSRSGLISNLLARDAVKNLPDIRPDEPAIVVAGYPNVGKSSFVNAITRADNEIAHYPFTTTGIHVGHFERNRIRYQIVDTPGLLDRPATERNDIERQAVSAIEHLADIILFMTDASEACGYPLADQLALRDDVIERFREREIPVLTVNNKSDRSEAIAADCQMSIKYDEGIDTVLTTTVDAAGWEPDIPPSRQA